jgi:hypothetical protein
VQQEQGVAIGRIFIALVAILKIAICISLDNALQNAESTQLSHLDFRQSENVNQVTLDV